MKNRIKINMWIGDKITLSEELEELKELGVNFTTIQDQQKSKILIDNEEIKDL